MCVWTKPAYTADRQTYDLPESIEAICFPHERNPVNVQHCIGHIIDQLFVHWFDRVSDIIHLKVIQPH